MASKRDLKKRVNYMVFDVVEECFSLQLYDESKKEKTDLFIEEAADFLEEIIHQINVACTKKEFGPIKEKIELKSDEWIDKLNDLQ